jgi:hypothetical protein
MSSTQGQRIEANCKIIWGKSYDYDLDIETDDYINYLCHVKKDFGESYGPLLMMTCLCRSSEAAWAELDRMLELCAEQVVRGTPMTDDKRLEIFGGPKGEHKNILTIFMNECRKREGAKPA